MLGKLFSTSKVANLEVFVWLDLNVRLVTVFGEVDQNVIWLDVPMRNPFAMQECKAFKKLLGNRPDLVKSLVFVKLYLCCLLIVTCFV